jgi:CubicO group peptidase (beta-lactamase class C family)
MSDLDAIAAETGFSGVVRIADEVSVYGLADRGHDVANERSTQFATASGTKGLTALTVVSLIEDGTLELSTRAREHLGSDLPLVGEDVTLEHLLAHRSGIGDYLDEESDLDLSDYPAVPVHELATTEQYVHALEGRPPKFAPGERFVYCNSGYVILALIAERASGVPFDELVRTRVCDRAGMADTAFLRSDELPGRAALGYVETAGPLRTNVFHLPVRGSGDGGMYTTIDDVFALWRALYGGRIVSPEWVAELTRPRSEGHGRRYGLGFWLHPTNDTVILEGSDAGVSFRTAHRPSTHATYAVVSNTTTGAWPIVRAVEPELFD